MQPEALNEARDWLRRAERDLQAARIIQESPAPLRDVSAYHCQQAAEKALKAFLSAHDFEFPKTHNLERLVSWCQSLDAEFSTFMSSAQFLNPYATRYRYPGGPVEPLDEDTHRAIRLAEDLFAFVRDRLNLPDRC